MKAQDFIEKLKSHGIDSYYGVPDSLLKSICAYISDHSDKQHNIITANEGNAIGLACGHYLATGRPAMVYMQNSGQGNVVNPLLSLMDEDVYSIPVLLLIGWRGEPGVHDEPQHVKQGKVTLELLETMGIAYAVISEEKSKAMTQIDEACAYMSSMNRPYALIARKTTFDTYKLQNKRFNNATMTREQAIGTVAACLQVDDIIISTTGQISRELYEYRTNNKQSHQSDFLTVGAMGHSSSIAMGVALKKPERRVICMDGDGSFLMHMGATAIVGNAGLQNLRHIIFNNAAHDSVGSQPTVADKLDIASVVKACGYTAYYKAETKQELIQLMPEFLNTQGTGLLEVKVLCGARADLGRPKERPYENKESFMRFVEEPHTIIGAGSVEQLKNIISENGWKKLQIFSSVGRQAAMKTKLAELLSACEVVYYTDISQNPTHTDVEKALSSLTGHADAFIAIGGGSVIDFAKTYRICRDNDLSVNDCLNRGESLIRNTPLVAIPTTAGTGSETTRFAVIYVDTEKKSLDAAAVLPDYAIIDSDLMKTAPALLKASCGMDALAQCIEGYWAKGASPESDMYALQALELCRDNLVGFVNTQESHFAEKMSQAANLAGKCISISRTTAAHALSYKITQLYGIPHGHAVALSLPGLSEIHTKKATQASTLCMKMKKISDILGANTCGIKAWFYNLYEKIGIEYHLHNLAIHNLDAIVQGVNSDRLKNNPIYLTATDLRNTFTF